MKIFIFYPALFLFSILFVTCKKVNEPEPLSLPPITMEGKNTMGCIINGELFTVSGKQLRGGWSHNGTHSFYASNSTPPYIFFSAKQEAPKIKILIVLELFEGKSVYELNNKEKSVGIVYMPANNYMFASSEYTTTSEYKGRVEILKLVNNYETGEGFVSGLFEFDAIDSRGDVIEVREGRFDLSFGW